MELESTVRGLNIKVREDITNLEAHSGLCWLDVMSKNRWTQIIFAQMEIALTYSHETALQSSFERNSAHTQDKEPSVTKNVVRTPRCRHRHEEGPKVIE